MASKVSSNGAKYLHGPQPTKEDIFLAALASSSTTTRATNPDHNAHYTCFCGLMHVSTGAAIGAVLEILICMFYLTLTILKFGDTHNYIGSRTLNTIVVGITILLDIGLICGIKFSKPWLFVVHVIWHSLLLVLMSLLTVSLGMQFHEYYNSYTQRELPMTAVMWTTMAILPTIGLIDVIFLVFFIIITIRTFQYLRQKDALRT